MARPVNPARTVELLDAIIEYLMTHGIAGLSLRPLAKAVGSSSRGLLYHFGSKEGIVDRAFSLLRERQRAAYERMTPPTFSPPSSGCREIWQAMSAPESEPYFRLFFEAYSLALGQPRRFANFLRTAIEDWLEFVAHPMRREGFSRSDARVFATVVLAGFRGFMLDYCASHDRKRLDRALDLWLQALDAVPLRPRRRL